MKTNMTGSRRKKRQSGEGGAGKIIAVMGDMGHPDNIEN